MFRARLRELDASQEEMVPLSLQWCGCDGGEREELGWQHCPWVPGSLGPQPPTPTLTPVPHLPSADRSHPCHLSSPNTAQCLAPVSYPDGDLWQRVAGLLLSSAILAPWHHVVFWLAPLFRGAPQFTSTELTPQRLLLESSHGLPSKNRGFVCICLRYTWLL